MDSNLCNVSHSHSNVLTELLLLYSKSPPSCLYTGSILSIFKWLIIVSKFQEMDCCRNFHPCIFIENCHYASSPLFFLGRPVGLCPSESFMMAISSSPRTYCFPTRGSFFSWQMRRIIDLEYPSISATCADVYCLYMVWIVSWICTLLGVFPIFFSLFNSGDKAHRVFLTISFDWHPFTI